MSEAELPEPKYWELQLNKLQIMLDSANENGLFSDEPDAYKKLIGDIIGAIAGLKKKKPEIIEARTKYSFVTCEFNQYINSTKFRWRFKYLYGGPAFIYLIAFFSAILVMWLFFWPSLDFNIFWVPSSAFLWGAVGGLLNGFWKLWQHACSREIRKVWYNWYISLPLMGAILGALTHLILLSGLLAITGDIQIQSQFLPMLLSGLAGFSAKWAVELLENITKMIKIQG